MIPANKLLDKAKEMCEGRSYAALARALEVTPQTVHQWKTGDVPLPTERIVEISKIARVPVDEWVMRILADQSKGEAHKVLEGIVKRLGFAAVVTLCVVTSTLPGTAKAATTGFQAVAGLQQCLLCKIL
jgi:hypothetical protein